MEKASECIKIIAADSWGFERFNCNNCNIGIAIMFQFKAEMSTEIYQKLFEHGLVRCGFVFYIPDKYHTCCKYHQTRIEIDKFVMSKDNTKKYRRFKNFLKNSNGKEEIQENLEEEFISLLENICCELKVPISEFKLVRAKNSKKHYLAFKYFNQVYKEDSTFREKLSNCVKNIGFPISLAEDSLLVYFDKIPPKKKQGKPKKLTISFEEPNFTEEKFELFNHYNKLRHEGKNANDQALFEDWQCTSYLESSGKKGSKHMVVRIDGVIFSVSFVDILPEYWVSMYCYYNPDFLWLSPGTISIFLELEEAKKLKEEHSSLKFFSLDHFIPGIKKCAYKTNFHPTEAINLKTGKFELVDDNCTFIGEELTWERKEESETVKGFISQFDKEVEDLEKEVQKSVSNEENSSRAGS